MPDVRSSLTSAVVLDGRAGAPHAQAEDARVFPLELCTHAIRVWKTADRRLSQLLQLRDWGHTAGRAAAKDTEIAAPMLAGSHGRWQATSFLPRYMQIGRSSI